MCMLHEHAYSTEMTYTAKVSNGTEFLHTLYSAILKTPVKSCNIAPTLYSKYYGSYKMILSIRPLKSPMTPLENPFQGILF